jgi:hypothetical protein
VVPWVEILDIGAVTFGLEMLLLLGGRAAIDTLRRGVAPIALGVFAACGLGWMRMAGAGNSNSWVSCLLRDGLPRGGVATKLP